MTSLRHFIQNAADRFPQHRAVLQEVYRLLQDENPAWDHIVRVLISALAERDLPDPWLFDGEPDPLVDLDVYPEEEALFAAEIR